MPTIKPKCADYSEVFDSFEGIGKAAKKRQFPAAALQNFRILPDGSLEKRCGFLLQHHFSAAIRGIWQGLLNGQSAFFAVAGNKVYARRDTDFEEVFTLTTSSGDVNLFAYRSHLYLMDGTEIYLYRESENTFSAVKGYVPKIGRNWHPTTMGDFAESLNLLTDRVRIGYQNSDGSRRFELPYAAASIDSVRADGKRITDFTFTPGASHFTLPEIYSWVEIGMTLQDAEDMSQQIKKAVYCLCERLHDKERLFLYGGSEGTYVFGCGEVSDFMMTSCLADYTDVDHLYFTNEMMLTIGNSANPVTAMFKNHDRLLAFHAHGAEAISVIDSTDLLKFPDRVSSYSVLRNCGCTAHYPHVEWDNQTVLVNYGGIYLLSSNASDPDRFELNPISHQIEELKTASFAENAAVFYDAPHGEYWFYDKAHGSCVWVYQAKEKNWYSFTGFAPSMFLSVQGRSGFVQGNGCFLFDESQFSDNGEPIRALLESNVLDFDSPETVKRALRIGLLAECFGTSLDIKLWSENRKKEFSQKLDKAASGGLPIHLDRRVGLGRFRILRISVADNGYIRSRIHRLALFANS